MIAACMSADEQTDWDGFNRQVARPSRSPCVDCFLAFATEMRAEGRCNGVPGRARPRPPDVSVGVRGRTALDPEERHQRRLASWRKYRAKVRARG